MSTRIGFIGLGIMGQGMVRNLLSAGFEVTVWNRTAEKMNAMVEAGAKTADSPRDLAAQTEIIMTCVSDTPDVQAVITGPDGVIEGAKSGSLVVDMSTISPKVTRELAAVLESRGVHMLDAPISGGSEGAAKGTLSIMVGGEAEQVERARPAFDAMGKTTTHVGPIGAGQSVKIVNQILVVVTCLGVSEALVFAEAGGLDLQKTLAAVEGGAAGSWMLSNRGSQAIVRDWKPGFTIDLQQKDLRLALEAAEELGIPLLGTGLVHNLYKTLQRAGLGGDGNHALIKALENLSGVCVGGEATKSAE